MFYSRLENFVEGLVKRRRDKAQNSKTNMSGKTQIRSEKIQS